MQRARVLPVQVQPRRAVALLRARRARAAPAPACRAPCDLPARVPHARSAAPTACAKGISARRRASHSRVQVTPPPGAPSWRIALARYVSQLLTCRSQLLQSCSTSGSRAPGSSSRARSAGPAPGSLARVARGAARAAGCGRGSPRWTPGTLAPGAPSDLSDTMLARHASRLGVPRARRGGVRAGRRVARAERPAVQRKAGLARRAGRRGTACCRLRPFVCTSRHVAPSHSLRHAPSADACWRNVRCSPSFRKMVTRKSARPPTSERARPPA